MDRQIILDEPGATLWSYPDLGIVHHRIHRPLQGREFRDVILRGLEAFRAIGASRWLSDDRKNAPLPRDDGLWAQEVFLPQALEAGWKAWAMVTPESPEGERNVRTFTAWGEPLGLKVRLFTDPGEALAWLVAA